MKSGVMILLPALTAAVGCGRTQAPSSPGRQAVIFQSSVSLGDPHIVSDSTNRLSILYSIYEPLVAVDDFGAFQPALAEQWAVSADARTWVFTLRKGVVFHNGDMLTARDVVASFRRALDPAIGGAFGTQGVLATYLGTADITSRDEATVRIVTAEPMADLLDLVSAIVIGPERELGRLPDTYVGTGPYRIETQSDSRVELRAHERYWGPAPAHRTLRFVAEPDPEKRIDAVLKGEADIAAGRPVGRLWP
jgi:peptide/nickel transport system substrate-binding protein